MLVGSVATTQSIILGDGTTEVLPKDTPSRLSVAEWGALKRLADVEFDQDGTFRISANTVHRVGRLSVDGLTVTVPPPVAPRLFTLWLGLAGGKFDQISHSTSDVSAGTQDEADFLRPIARLLVEEADRVLRRHVARLYQPTIERSLVLRGRPLWQAGFGRHPATGVDCRFFQLTSDIPLNRAIRCALEVAAGLLSATPWEGSEIGRAHV